MDQIEHINNCTNCIYFKKSYSICDNKNSMNYNSLVGDIILCSNYEGIGLCHTISNVKEYLKDKYINNNNKDEENKG